MHSRVWSSTTVGIDAVPIEIETDIRSGLPRHRVVGLPYGAVCESLDRIWSALSNSDLPVPRGVITINLAPADLRKDSAALDLPIAVGMLAVSGHNVSVDVLDGAMVLGELALDGSVRPVRGVLASALEAGRLGFRSMIVPTANAGEAAIVDEVEVFGVDTLRDAVAAASGRGTRWRRRSVSEGRSDAAAHYLDLGDVAGQEQAKRAMTIAAAGAHNVLLVGPPGAGKTMLSRRLPALLPPMTFDESVEVTRVYSARGLLPTGGGLCGERPFRAPHHSISDAGLCGGGANPLPGEISLAHNGVLFLDELPEFRRSALESLRQPLEEGVVRIGRSQTSVEFPARLLLVASMNPCPCGYLTDPVRECICSSRAIMRYTDRISGPLLDRIDLHVDVAPVDIGELTTGSAGNRRESDEARGRIARVRAIQRERYGGSVEEPHRRLNGLLGPSQARAMCRPDRAGRSIIREAAQRLGLSARGVIRVLKVARTIADLSGSENVGSEHVSEAIQFRSVDRWFEPAA